MNDITPNTAVIELARLSRDLDAAGARIRHLEQDAVTKKHRYTIEFQKAFLKAEGSIQARTAQATIDTAEQKIAAELADAELRIVRSDIRILENRIDVGRSVVGVLRAEAQVVR